MRQSQGNPTSDSQKKGTTGEDIEVALAFFMTPKVFFVNLGRFCRSLLEIGRGGAYRVFFVSPDGF